MALKIQPKRVRQCCVILTPEPQRFSIVLAGRELLAVRWMDAPEGG